MVEITPEVVAQHGLSETEYARILEILGRDAESARARHLLGDVERALLLQVVPALAEAPADRGAVGDLRAGRERRRGRPRRRHGGDLQDREPQPSELHRALSGGGDRGGRHPARRVHHGRAAGRAAQLAALRRARAPENPPSGRRRGRRDRRLRQLRRRAHRGRRGDLPPRLQRQHPGQRHVRRPRAARPDLLRARGRPGQSGGVRRVEDRPRRHPRRHHGIR